MRVKVRLGFVLDYKQLNKKSADSDRALTHLTLTHRPWVINLWSMPAWGKGITRVLGQNIIDRR